MRDTAFLPKALQSSRSKKEDEFISKVLQSKEVSGSLVNRYSFNRDELRSYHHEERLQKLASMPVVGKALDIAILIRQSQVNKSVDHAAAAQACLIATQAIKLMAEVSKTPALYMKLHSTETFAPQPTLSNPYSSTRSALPHTPPPAFNSLRAAYSKPAYIMPSTKVEIPKSVQVSSVDTITSALRRLEEEQQADAKRRKKINMH